MLTRWWLLLMALLLSLPGLAPAGMGLAVAEAPTHVRMADAADRAVLACTLQVDSAAAGCGLEAERDDLLGDTLADAMADLNGLPVQGSTRPQVSPAGPWHHGPPRLLRRAPVLDGLLRPPSASMVLA